MMLSHRLWLATLVTVAAPGTTVADALPPMMLPQRVPAGAIEIAEAMSTARPGETIVIRGRITEGNDVFVQNRAIFRLADEAAMPACCAPGSHASNTACSVPANRRATVQFLDTRGRLYRMGLRGRHGLSVGKEVFIVGTVHEADNDRTLIINATAMHVPVGDVPVGLFLDREPENAVDVSDARGTVAVGDRVILRGRVGGSPEPLADGRMMMTIVGRDLAPCPPRQPDGSGCATPWDSCRAAESERLAHSVRVEATDDRGEPIRSGFRGRRNLTEGSAVTVFGTIVSIDSGVPVVRATGIRVAELPVGGGDSIDRTTFSTGSDE